MPLTVITVKSVPQSLRGDLTKWMQEIATGVYVGNFNVKVREQLWNRVKESIGEGEATISFTYRNEIGYNYNTINTQREVKDFDGIPLVLIPNDKKVTLETEKLGFSAAAKFRKIKKFSTAYIPVISKPYVVIDIETDGLEENRNSIIEIGALKVDGLGKYEFSYLIKNKKELPRTIIELTGITQDIIDKHGLPIEQVLSKLLDFIGDKVIVGYNIDFDIKFINNALKKHNMPLLKNKRYDLMRYVKHEKQFLGNYKLQTVLSSYGINQEVPHRALSDSKLIYKLSLKVNKFLKAIERN